MRHVLLAASLVMAMLGFQAGHAAFQPLTHLYTTAVVSSPPPDIPCGSLGIPCP